MTNSKSAPALVFVDLETTGLNPIRYFKNCIRPWHEICEIGLITAGAKTLEILDSFNAKVKVKYPERLEKTAQEVNGYDENDWGNAVELKKALEAIIPKIEKSRLVVYNLSFDMAFLNIGFRKCGLTYKPEYRPLDLLNYAEGFLAARNRRPASLSLNSVADLLGLPAEPLPHRAINGAMTAYEVYKKLQKSPLILPQPQDQNKTPEGGC